MIPLSIYKAALASSSHLHTCENYVLGLKMIMSFSRMKSNLKRPTSQG